MLHEKISLGTIIYTLLLKAFLGLKTLDASKEQHVFFDNYT